MTISGSSEAYCSGGQYAESMDTTTKQEEVLEDKEAVKDKTVSDLVSDLDSLQPLCSCAECSGNKEAYTSEKQVNTEIVQYSQNDGPWTIHHYYECVEAAMETAKKNNDAKILLQLVRRMQIIEHGAYVQSTIAVSQATVNKMNILLNQVFHAYDYNKCQKAKDMAMKLYSVYMCNLSEYDVSEGLVAGFRGVASFFIDNVTAIKSEKDEESWLPPNDVIMHLLINRPKKKRT